MEIKCSNPAFATRSFITNSAIGERQILPWQTNSIFIMEILLLFFM